jgi:hypothetical protein
MIYSIAVLDICDFEAIGRKMPSGTGVDATLDNGAVVGKHRKRIAITLTHSAVLLLLDWT